MTILGRILPHAKGAGAANMALDEALLEDVAAQRSFAYIRTYEWSIPTLSLGYFQRLEDATAQQRFRSVPIVRRATGGGALWHDHEITYSVIIPAEHKFARHAQMFYRVVHEAVRQVLSGHGLPIARRCDREKAPDDQLSPQSPAKSYRPFLCFADKDAEDLVSNGVKIVGSAQRRRAGAVLQHGSVLIAGSSTTPELPGLSDLLHEREFQPPNAWSDPIVRAVADALELTTELVEIPENVRLRSAELEAVIYTNPEWTGRR